MYDHLADDLPVVVGMACRFPGADSTDSYWQRLMSGCSAIAPARRWGSTDGLYGGFLDGIDEFDARFFRISPNEAQCMDPQQRLLLQTVQHAIDDAYLTADDLRDLRCGVFATGLPGDYRTLVAQRKEASLSAYSFLGNAPSSLSGRISYVYDLGGPSVTVDTACSSSLTALHTALLNLRSGECDAAIVGAASVFSTPEVLRFSRFAGMSSPSGSSIPFTFDSDGFLPAEGVAAVVLMRYTEAVNRGLPVLGTVVASGLNHNGTTNGLSAPSARAQGDLLSGLYHRSGIDPAQVALVEAHGTGTELGDPLEIDGLRRAFRGVSQCTLGAVKPLIGHTLVCSGLAALIKVLLAFQNSTIPPGPALGEGNGYLDVAPLQINTEAEQWPEEQPLAAVSAFGFTGSNAHLVIRRPRPPARMARTKSVRGPHQMKRLRAFCLSAASKESLNQLAIDLQTRIKSATGNEMDDMASLLLHRPSYKYQLVIVASSAQELTDALAAGEDVFPNGLEDDEIRLVQAWRAGDIRTLRERLPSPASLMPASLPHYPFRRQRHWVLDDDQVPIEPEDNAELALRLSSEIGALLGVSTGEDEVHPDTPIATLGLDSLSAVQIMAPYQEAGSQVKAHDLFQFDTVADMAAAISSTMPPENDQSAVDLKLADHNSTVDTASQICWERYGDGVATVLLPPMNATGQAWLQQIPAVLELGRSVIIPTYPGHADLKFDKSRFSLEALAAEVAELARSCGGVDLVGWSLGGVIALLTALDYPKNVRSLTLIETAPKYGQNFFERTLDLRDELKSQVDLLEVIFNHSGEPTSAFEAKASMETLAEYFSALTAFDVVDQLPLLRVPSLILHGEEDVVVAREMVTLFDAIPSSRIVEVPGHGHYLPLTGGRIVNQALVDFWVKTDKKLHSKDRSA